KSGVHPKMAQDLARHSTIDLTMNHYTHLRLHDQAAAVEALPSLLPRTGPGREALRATGTDGDSPTNSFPTGPKTGPRLALKLAPAVDSGCEQVRANEVGQPLEGSELSSCRTSTLRGVESDCERMSEGWVRGLEPPTFRSTV